MSILWLFSMMVTSLGGGMIAITPIHLSVYYGESTNESVIPPFPERQAKLKRKAWENTIFD